MYSRVPPNLVSPSLESTKPEKVWLKALSKSVTPLPYTTSLDLTVTVITFLVTVMVSSALAVLVCPAPVAVKITLYVYVPGFSWLPFNIIVSVVSSVSSAPSLNHLTV